MRACWLKWVGRDWSISADYIWLNYSDANTGEYWKLGTSDESFTMMPPDYVGRKFYLDVIAGHINTEAVSGITGYRGIWHDGASHYYIDGNVMKNGEVAVLSYDSETGKYGGPGLE